MKKYLAIGHFKESKDLTSIAMKATTKENFVKNMLCNEFVAYVIITEKMMNKIESMCGMDLFNHVKKMTTNYRRWNDVVEYIEQCYDIMEDRMCNAQ